MAIEARCPHCESTIRAADKYAGQQVKCPKCAGVMQVPGAASPAAPAVVSVAAVAPPTPPTAPAEAVPAETAAAAPTTAGFGSDVPLVNVGGDDHWRKSVSRKKTAARKSSGSPAWLWPVVALALCGVVAAGLFVWRRQPAGETDVAVEEQSPSVEVAQATSADETASTAADIPAKPSDEVTRPQPAEGDADADSSDASVSPVAQAEPGDATPASTSSPEDAVAMTASPTTSDTANTPEPASPPDTASQDTASQDTDEPATGTEVAAAASSEPVELKGPPEEVLKEHGIRIVGDQATLIDEARPAITAALNDAKKLRLSLTRSYAEAMKLERLQKELKTEYGNRSAALAQVNATGGSAQANNLLVGQLAAIQTKLEQVQEQVEASRAKLAEARESYIEHLLKTREIVKGVEQNYADAAADPQVKAALAKLSTGENELTLEPLGSFYRVQKELETLESQVLSDTIVARVQSGNLFVPTQINGEHTIEMVVDSGASVVTLPYEMAVKAGLKPTETDPEIRLQIADGSIITGKQITIASLRVGKFTAENVEAAVLGPEAVSAEPLLGMSFLSKFEMRIDSERGHLVLSRIEGTEGSDRIR